MLSFVRFRQEFAPGAYIIDMGKEPQTIENGLKPYGLVYQLIVTERIPVEWAILPNKGKDAADFTVGGKSYRAGSFILSGERVTARVEALIKAWRSKGVLIDGTLAVGFEAPIHKQLTNWPRAVLDAQTAQQLVVPFYTNAEIPTSSYVTAGNPTLLTNCGDVYVLPHADPQNWTEASGYFSALSNFIVSGGNLWSACHAVSALESIPGGNFLSTNGLVIWKDHDNGTPPYTYNSSVMSDPVMQFIGTLDASTQNGSEQIFLPSSNGWRTTTTIGITDPDHSQAGKGLVSPGPGTLLAYGRAFGKEIQGFVMYEAGHNLDAGTLASRAAAQRAYFNFILLSGLQKAIAITETRFPETVNPNKSYPVSVKASGGIGTIQYHWMNDCGGTFLDSTASSTTFIAPAEGGKCAIRVEVADGCGRANFSSEISSVLSVAIDKNGNPLPGAGPGKCPDCFVGEKNHFIGPIIHLTITGVVTYRFRIFNTLGEFVCRLDGTITDADLTHLATSTSTTADGPRTEYEQRIIWSGRDSQGQKSGNGAYILMADLQYPANPDKGIRAKRETYYKTFGHVR